MVENFHASALSREYLARTVWMQGMLVHAYHLSNITTARTKLKGCKAVAAKAIFLCTQDSIESSDERHVLKRACVDVT